MGKKEKKALKRMQKKKKELWFERMLGSPPALYEGMSFENIKPLKIEDRHAYYADPHFGSTYRDKRGLNLLFDEFNDAGVRQIFGGGDVTDGHRVYPNQELDLYAIGYQAQVDDVVKNRPRIKGGSKSHEITGNHDDSFMKRGGANPVKEICRRRRDMKYEGVGYVRYLDEEMGTDMIVQHPGGGGYKNPSYGFTDWFARLKSRKYFPDILLHGHRHTNNQLYWMDSHCVEMGSTMKPTPYMIRKKLTGERGGWIVDMKRDEWGEIAKYDAKWIKVGDGII